MENILRTAVQDCGLFGCNITITSRKEDNIIEKSQIEVTKSSIPFSKKMQ